MSLRGPLVAVLVLVCSAALIFYLFQRQISTASFAFGVHPEVVAEIGRSLDDQKELARLDPERESEYRQRFERLETTLHRLQILAQSRDSLVRRHELILLVLFVVSGAAVAGVWGLRQARLQGRLERVQTALGELAAGRTDVRVGVRGRDTAGRIAAMIERTSRRMARDRRRLASLRNLSAWQEAARRHAHEMRTPLTATRLELTRIGDLMTGATPARDAEIRRAVDGAVEELDRLGRFAERFTSFARLPRPKRLRCDLGALLGEWVETYGGVWPGLALELVAPRPVAAPVDREMLRQVLVNLCDNSAHAGAGRVRLELSARPDAAGGVAMIEVADDGPGVAEEVRARIFEPYTTTRTIGEGMGLGLAIAKKILLDHGGDLELLPAAAAGEGAVGGAVFRLSLPLASEAESAEATGAMSEMRLS